MIRVATELHRLKLHHLDGKARSGELSARVSRHPHLDSDGSDSKQMTSFLYLLLILDGLFMAIVVLLQAGKGGGLAAVGGGGGTAMTEGILAGRQATSLLTRATWISGTIFLASALALSIISQRNAVPTSVIQVPTPNAAPVPILSTVGEGDSAVGNDGEGTPGEGATGQTGESVSDSGNGNDDESDSGSG